METTNDELVSINKWYFDTGCSNHMTSHQECLVNFDHSRKKKIIFADNTTISSKWFGDFFIKCEKGNHTFITRIFQAWQVTWWAWFNCFIKGLPCTLPTINIALWFTS